MDYIFDKKINDPNFAVVKHNTMVESGYDLPPVQNNVMNIAAVKAREVTNPDLWNGEVIISAEEYAAIHSITLNDAYKVLKKSALEMKEIELICDAYFDFSKGEVVPDLPDNIASATFYSDTIVASKPKHGNYKKMKVHIRLIDKIGYSDVGSFIYLRFGRDVLHLIQSATQDNHKDYTSYNYVNTVDFSTTPAKRLYELAVKWKKLGSCKKSVDDWKIFFGVFNKYEKIAEFKKWVLVPAINQVNSQGEFELTLDQQKLGRVVTHLIVIIKEKASKTVTAVDTMANSQLIADQLADSPVELSDNEKVIVKATADIYIIKNNIIDEKHKQNIYKKAISERWGLADYDKQQAELKAQSDKIIKQIEAEKQAEIEQKQEAEKQKLDNEQFIMLFESHSPQERMDILNEVKKLVSGIPIISTQFEKERANFTAHKDMMFRKYFKQVMGILDN